MTARQSYLYRTYNELARSRPYCEAGALPIDVLRIESYANYWNIRDMQAREDIFHFVMVMDEVYLEVVNKKQE